MDNNYESGPYGKQRFEPKRPDVPRQIEPQKLTKLSDQELRELLPDPNWTVKWEVIEKMYANFLTDCLKSRKLTKAMAVSYVYSQLTCPVCKQIINDPQLCH